MKHWKIQHVDYQVSDHSSQSPMLQNSAIQAGPSNHVVGAHAVSGTWIKTKDLQSPPHATSRSSLNSSASPQAPPSFRSNMSQECLRDCFAVTRVCALSSWLIFCLLLVRSWVVLAGNRCQLKALVHRSWSFALLVARPSPRHCKLCVNS